MSEDDIIVQYLVLPRDGDTACDKLVVEVVVGGVKVHAFDCGELLDVQDVFTVHGSRLKEREGMKEEERVIMRLDQTVKMIIILDERGKIVKLEYIDTDFYLNNINLCCSVFLCVALLT